QETRVSRALPDVLTKQVFQLRLTHAIYQRGGRAHNLALDLEELAQHPRHGRDGRHARLSGTWRSGLHAAVLRSLRFWRFFMDARGVRLSTCDFQPSTARLIIIADRSVAISCARPQQMRPRLPARVWPGGSVPIQRSSIGSEARW